MSQNIRIRTGANLSAILQSTVSIPQAFTELIKNSLQNEASFVKIYLNEDDTVILDDGGGFNDNVDSTGMTGFEKYFVFGNSYEQTGGNGIKLGHMGIGGKIANDKLAESGNPKWTVETKNKNGKCFRVTYQPGATEFLDDYTPSITGISSADSAIETETGTKITINNLNANIVRDGWPKGQIMGEVRTFFGALVSRLQRENIEFKVYVDDENMDFNYRLPGHNLGSKWVTFKYTDIDGTIKQSKFTYNLSVVSEQALKDICPLDGIDVISEVKICPFKLDNNSLLEEICEEIRTETGKPFKLSGDVLRTFADLRGHISCDDLSTVLDDTGMPAKDVSHHGLREDHCITKPFYGAAYRAVLDLIRAYLVLGVEEKRNKLNKLTLAVSKLVTRAVNIDFSLLRRDEDVSLDIDANIRDKFANENISADYIGAVRGAVYGNQFDPEAVSKQGRKEWWQQKKQSDKDILKDLEDILPPSEERKKKEKEEKEKNLPPDEIDKEQSGDEFDEDYMESLPDKKHINFRVEGLGKGLERICSRTQDADGFCVIVNSDNIQFKVYEKEESPLLLLLYISEILIKAVNTYNNPTISQQDLDIIVSTYFEDNFDTIKNDLVKLV